jgi:excisionase family DNA binding protein
MDTNLTAQQFYTIAEAGKVLRLSRTNLYYQIKAGKIPTVRMGKRVLIPGAYFEQLTEKAMAAVPQGAA